MASAGSRTGRRKPTAGVAGLAVSPAPKLAADRSKAKAKKVTDCGRCGATLTGQTAARVNDAGDPETLACRTCWKVYILAYQAEGDWGDICEKCASDSEGNKIFEKVAQVMLGEGVPSWFPSEVCQKHELAVTVTRPMIALLRAEFTELFGHTPESDKIPLTDISNEYGESVKALLLRNPLRPLLEVDVKRTAGIEQADMKLTPARQIKEDQAKKTFDYSKSSKEKEALANKLWNCSLSLEEIQAKTGTAPLTNMWKLGDLIRSAQPAGLGAPQASESSHAQPPSPGAAEDDDDDKPPRVMATEGDGPLLRTAISEVKRRRLDRKRCAFGEVDGRGSENGSTVARSTPQSRIRMRGKAAGVAESSPGAGLEACLSCPGPVPSFQARLGASWIYRSWLGKMHVRVWLAGLPGLSPNALASRGLGGPAFAIA